ncbi:MAG: hypothetical protein K1060chlam2_01134 [Chlamydiae bacterium]|nr:hypothetical protein [Chlamydiota bacterium]
MMESEKSETSQKSKPKPKPKVGGGSAALKALSASIGEKSEVEDKIELAIEFMRSILGKAEGRNFRDFWDAKKLCSSLFKEKINPIKRNHLWSEFIGLVDEARRLKEIVDEQSAFSIEQIELAIEGLQKEIENYHDLLQQIHPFKIPDTLKSLIKSENDYSNAQRELQLLKTLILRLDSLRKEILTIDMRISHKNRILKLLSKLGDRLFPKRKELVKKVSDAFILDVETFVKERFPEGEAKPSAPHYVIRDEIKSFQGLAKLLTLNTQSFSKTRKMLNESWDKIKEQAKEHKKEMGERSEEQKKNFDLLSEKVATFMEVCEKEESPERGKISDAADSLQDEMRNLSLNRDQVTVLRTKIQKARATALDKIKSKKAKLREAEMKRENELRDTLTEAVEKEANFSLEDLLKKEESLKKGLQELSLSPSKTLQFERDLSDLHGFILDKKMDQATSDQDLEALFDERKTLYEEIKKQMEFYRKEMGGSSLDFEKAMTYRELFDSAKIHLEKEIEALQKIEDKLYPS